MGDEATKPPTEAARVSAAKCVRCGKPVSARNRPFCSQRCADLDLGAWLKESYRVATDEEPDLDPEQRPVDKPDSSR